MPERELGLDHTVHEAARRQRRPDGCCCATAADRTTGRRSRAPPARSGSCTPPCNRCGAHPTGSRPATTLSLDRVGVVELAGLNAFRQIGLDPVCRPHVEQLVGGGRDRIGCHRPVTLGAGSGDCGRRGAARYDRRRMLRPNVDQRKSEILEAAVQVIIEVGFTEMTVADVAKVAGVSTALVHYHFSSKVDLITAAVRRRLRRRQGASRLGRRRPGFGGPPPRPRALRQPAVRPERRLVAAVDRDLGRDTPAAVRCGRRWRSSPSTRSR